MDMDIPAVTHEDVLARLRNYFYEVVPATYQTYCAVTALINVRVLRHFGIDAKLVTCQLWYAGPNGNFVVGFYRKEAQQWDGHVVCMANGWLLDAALHHIQKHLNVSVPNIVLSQCFGIASNVISRFDLRDGERLWWHHPPHDLQVEIPREPEDVVARFADELIGRISNNSAGAASAAGASRSEA
jgi:hypothetical protein